MNKDNRVFVRHITEAMIRVAEYIDGYTYENFHTDNKTVAATVREIEIIGEASNNIDEDFRNKHSNIPWRKMITARNKMIHEYFGVDIKITWEIAKNHLPNLLKDVEKILED